MQQGNQNYYHPYEEDGNTNISLNASDIGVSQSRLSGPDFVSFAKQLQYNQGTYGWISTSQKLLPDGTSQVSNLLAPLPVSKDASTSESLTEFKTERKDVTTLFLIDSKNRDRTAFPKPGYFTLRPPRPYKSVTSIQITQIKLLSSFFYFRASKGNLIIPMIERDRGSANNYQGYQLTEAVKIREGTYAINDLLNEIQIHMNATPLFYDYPNGFTDFVTAFTTNGDLGVNFNEPGDTFYDTLNDKYIPNPTKDYIVKAYWLTRYAGLTTYSIEQIKVAYYYPVLYEVFLDQDDTTTRPNLNLTLTTSILNPGETIYIRVVFNAQGLNDPVILELVDNNINLLDDYRSQHTFRYSLVNRYQVNYEANTLRVNIFSLSLNTSLLNLFTITRSKSLSAGLQQIGYSSNTYTALSNSLNQAKVVFSDMYNYIQNQLVTYFAIGYATYASQYFVNTDNILNLQNGFNASNIRSGYTLEYLTSGQQPLVSTASLYADSPGYWPRFIPANTGSSAGGIDPSGINISTSLIPYSVTTSNFQFGLQAIDSSNYYIQTNQSTRSVDVVLTIKPARYTVLKFRSPARQTLQVETLPLPYYYRFSDFNKQGLYSNVLDLSNNNVPQKYFDLSYSYVYTTTGDNQNKYMDQSNYSSFNLTQPFGTNFSTSYGLAPSLVLNVQSNFAQFEFTAPVPSTSLVSTLSVYNTAITFVSLDTSFPGSVEAYVYHDRAGFMADINSNRLRQESPYHFIASSIVTSNGTDSLTINISTFTNHTYYTLFRSSELAFQNINYKAFVYTAISSFVTIKTDYINFDPKADPTSPSNLTNMPFVENYNRDFIRLPTGSNLQGLDPDNSQFSKSLAISLKPIGYDISGVSDDLTDYKGYIAGRPGFYPNTQFRVDPLSEYSFQNLSPFNEATNSYLGPGSLNKILKPITNAPYTYKTNSNSEIKIVNWYDGYSIPPQQNDTFLATNLISTAVRSSFQQYINADGTYETDRQGQIKFGEGIYAIGFLPEDGLYEISSFTFKSTVYPIGGNVNSQDPNTNIEYVGVYSGSYVVNSAVIQISSAITVLKKIGTKTYAPSTLSNTPQFGVELGTFYTFGFDPSFVAASNVKLNGYTQNSNQLLSYDSMYYFVPFNTVGSNVTFACLAGSILPYPLYQTPSTTTSYFGQTTKNPVGSIQQTTYILPSTIYNANSNYGPKNGYSLTQYQYEQSQPITTTSIGFRDFKNLIDNDDALFTFSVRFSTSIGTIATTNVGINTFSTEYDDKLWVVNSLTNMSSITNSNLTFKGMEYASSLSTIIRNTPGATEDSIKYLLTSPSTLQNYSYSRISTVFNAFTYSEMTGNDISTTVRSFDLNPNSQSITVWLWGGGGGTSQYLSTNTYGYQAYGGAGAYVKAQINVPLLISNYNTTKVHVVVGKGGLRDNFQFSSFREQIIGYEQPRYGGGGTSLSFTKGSTVISTHQNDILLQGGGFSGLFIGSNLTTATPLLIVGGGGAAGTDTLGGPGGFGLPAQVFSTIKSRFATITLNASNSPQVTLTGIQDVDNLSVADAFSGLSNFIDGNLLTLWNPVSQPYLQPYNYTPYPRTYRTTYNFGSNVSTISRLRFYGNAQGDASHLPTGFIVYNNLTKTQVLYSNTNIGYNDFLYLNNGTFSQNVFDMNLTSPMISTTTILTTGWAVVGTNTSNQLQYSLDGSNWLNAQTGGYRFNSQGGFCVRYLGGIWLAGGNGSSITLSGIGSNVSAHPSFGSIFCEGVIISATGKYQIILSPGRPPFFSTDYAVSWSSISSLPADNWKDGAMSVTADYIALISDSTIYISTDYGITWSGQYVTNDLTSITVSATGKYMYVLSSTYQYDNFYFSYVFRSDNFGISFRSIFSVFYYQGICIRCSGSGRYVTFCFQSGYLTYSSNYGDSFTYYFVNFNPLGKFAISSSGQYQSYPNGLLGVYISNNYLSSGFNVSLGGSYVYSVAMSATGRYQIAGTNNGIYVSTNFGASWTLTASGINGYNTALSGDGKYALIVPSTGLVYRSIATTPSVVYPYIFYSLNGVTWIPTTITEFDGDLIRAFSYLPSKGLWIAGGRSGTCGSFLTSTDGINWTLSGISNAFVSGEALGIRLLNGILWAVGNGDANGKKSTDGFTWENVPGLQGYDITYGQGKYLATGFNGPPFFIGIIYSPNGSDWYSVNPTNLSGFFGLAITFSVTRAEPNGIFTATGISPSLTKVYWSRDGINWYFTFQSSFTANTAYYGVSNGFIGGNAYKAGALLESPAGTYTKKSGISSEGSYVGAYDTYVYSAQSYTTDLCVVATRAAANSSSPWGSILGFDPTPTALGAAVAYSFVIGFNGLISITANDESLGSYGQYINSTILRITYDGTNVRYYINDGLVATVARAIGAPLFVVATFDQVNTSISNIRFGTVANTLGDTLLTTGTAQWITTGAGASGGGASVKQTSILRSTDAFTWNTILIGGYNRNLVEVGLSVDYGVLSVVPNLSTFYVEIQKVTEYQLYAYELQAFGAAATFDPTSASYTLSNVIDDNLTTSYWPLDSQTKSLTNYPFTLTFSNVVSTINYLQFYTVASNHQAFTSIDFGTSLPAGPLFTLSNIAPTNFSTTSGVYLYQVPIIPALSNISSFYINLGKTTASSINLTEIRAIYDQTNAINEFRATGVVDLDNRGGFSTDIVTKLIDGSLATIWNVGSWNVNTTSQTIRLVFSFSTSISQLNHMQVYNWLTTDNFHTITGIAVYRDTTKTTVLYSNASVSATQYLTYRLFDFDITPVQNVTSIYVELTKVTAYPNYQPYLNEVKFYNIGATFGDIGGYTGGYIQTMVKLPQSITPQTGGGGSEFVGGKGGIGSQISTVYYGSTGTTYRGGSPAPYSGNAQWISSFLYLSTTAGGGGGGYQGGGGGGTSSFINALYPGLTTGAAGGAGGGGGGFFSTVQSISPSGVITPLITLLEYGTALPGSNITPSNYIAAGLGQQSTLIGSNVISPLSATSYYAYGGIPSVENGAGGHGLVIVSYEASVTVNPAANSLTANPVFVDSSKLSLFQAPVITTDFNRTLTFGSYTDPIEYSSFSGLNWVWYRAFLSFVGGKLLPTMTPSIVTPSYPVNEFPHLPTLVYDIFVEQFTNVRNFFNRTNFTYANAVSITNALAFGFQLFQVNFVVLPYTSPYYIEFTEIYCLLDYLQGVNNLMYPHISPINPTIDRVFGGIPRFGYWANPFLKNVTFVGFDIAPSIFTPSTLVGLVGGRTPVQMQAMYGLAIEQNLSSGSYVLKDIMSYKPNLTDIQIIGSNWLRLSQFDESFTIRTPESEFMTQYLSVQPYDFKNALEGKLPLFNYKTYYTSINNGNTVIQSPIHMINDFEGTQIFFYSYQNSNIENRSSLSITHYYGLTSSLVLLNQQLVLNRSNSATEILGTATREIPASTFMNSVNKFGYTTLTPTTYYPDVTITPGTNNYYNTYSPLSEISSVNVGRFINDINGNIYVSHSSGVELYQNICTIQIYQKQFTKTKSEYASPSQILGNYKSGNSNPYYDFFYSKYNNIWHIQGTQNMSTLYGARLNSPYDFTVTTSFLNQVFCPSHKITLIKKAAGINPIVQTEDLTTYPSYPHTEMFFYKNFSSLTTDISGQFALEKTSNFAYKDMFSGYFFNSFINNINLDKSTYFNNGNDDSFNYLAVRAYSPSEQFKCLLRMYLPGRYDFGFVTIRDLSNEYVTVQNTTIVNPDYRDVLNQFNIKFQFASRAFGATGLPGFPGSNISSVQFGDFLRQYINIYNVIQTNQVVVSSVTTAINTGITNLVTGDLKYILPSTIASRERIEDPLEFKILFSTVVVQNTAGCETNTNRSIDEYGLGYNLGFARLDTAFNTIQRANSFFKILDDYIYLRMNPEFNMNRLDISRQENFATTQEATSESQLYNCKLLLNTFGSYAQTVIQNPVFFNPPIGKLDKLSFQWYDITGTLIDNIDCEWSGAIQVTERTDVATADSTLPK